MSTSAKPSPNHYASSVTPTATSNAVQQPPAPGSATPAAISDSNSSVPIPDSPLSSTSSPFSSSSPIVITDGEWVYPNTGDGKYFTATQAQIYIGNLFIDELVQLQFAYQGNRIPMYGYCSVEADAFGTGRRLVQGQLAINFVCEGYLYTALKEHQRLNDLPSSLSSSSATQAGSQIQSLITQYNSLAGQNNSGMTTSGQKAAAAQLTALSTKITNLAAAGGPDAITAAKKAMTTTKEYPNAISLDIPFEIVCSLTGAGRTVTRKLHNCLLISNEQVYDQSGQTLLDCYGFVARSAN